LLLLQEGRAYFNELSSSLGRDSAALLREASAAIEEVSLFD
jgi:predicted DNA-binding protein